MEFDLLLRLAFALALTLDQVPNLLLLLPCLFLLASGKAAAYIPSHYFYS
jgi:hypothetical protein